MPANNVESRFRRSNNVNNNLQGDAIAAAVGVFNEERVTAYPTGAVFSVGCDLNSETTVMRLLELKQHPIDKGPILVATSYEQLRLYIGDIMLTNAQREAILSRWPDPVTFVLPAPATAPCWLTGCFGLLAVRVTDHPSVIVLYQACGKPLVSTSANSSGLLPC